MFRQFILFSVLLVVCASSDFLPRLEQRIIGGEDAEIKNFPYHVGLSEGGSYFCGGAIISETVIVTAAHCVYDMSSRDITVQAGSARLSGHSVRHAVKKIIVHEKFDEFDQENDVALVVLVDPLKYSDTIQPIPLAESGAKDKPGAIARVSGWGLLSENGVMPDTLQWVDLKIIDSKKCNENYSVIKIKIRESMICAGVPGGKKDACVEDSGGPLVSEGKLVGIVSWGIGCARVEYPGVYAKVSFLREWIDKHRPDKK